MKTTLLALSLSLLSMSAFALESSDTPALLSALADDGIQTVAMSDNDMAETRGAGAPGVSLNEYYYVWKNYGSTNDYRYYMYNFSTSLYGGKDEYSSVGLGYRYGDIFYATTKGLNAAMNTYVKKEENTKYAYQYYGQWVNITNFARASNSWARPSGSPTYW